MEKREFVCTSIESPTRSTGQDVVNFSVGGADGLPAILMRNGSVSAVGDLMLLGYSPGGGRYASGRCKEMAGGTDSLLVHDCPTEPGGSGAPVMMLVGGQPVIVGVHQGEGIRYNKATRVFQDQ